jgi:hypothetical protein
VSAAGTILALALACCVSVQTLGCGADESTPTPKQLMLSACPTIPELAPNTFALLEEARLPQLKALISRDLTDPQFAALLDAVLTLVRDLTPEQLRAFGGLALNPNFSGFSTAVVAVLQFIGGTEDGLQPYRRPLVTEMHRLATRCDAASLLVALDQVITAPELPEILSDLSLLLENDLLQSLLDTRGALSRDGFSALICNAAANLTQPGFSVTNDLVQPLAALNILPLDVPPWSTFLRNIDALLAEERPLRRALGDTICCDLYDVPACDRITARSHPLERDPVFVWAIHELMSYPHPQLGHVLDDFKDFLADPKIGASLEPVANVMSRIAETIAVRRAFLSLVRALLDPDRAAALFREVALLVNSGSLKELLGVVRVISRGCTLDELNP